MHLVRMHPGSRIYDNPELGQLGLLGVGGRVPPELLPCAASPGHPIERGSPFFSPLPKLLSGFLATTTHALPFLSFSTVQRS